MRWFNPKAVAGPRLTFEVPHRLRAMVRARESSVILLAVVVGLMGGLVVAAMGQIVGLMHSVFFGLDPGERLSGRVSLNPIYAFLTPTLGGLLFGLVSAYITRRRGTEVDPIEANALHGGRMSMRGSLIVAAQTVWSSGIGASDGDDCDVEFWMILLELIGNAKVVIAMKMSTAEEDMTIQEGFDGGRNHRIL